SISLATNRVTTVQGVLATNVTVTLTDVDSTNPNDLTLSAISSNPSAVAGTNVFFTGTGLTRQMWIAPNGVGLGTATLTIFVVDNLESARLLTSSTTIDVTVNSVKQAVFANPSAIVVNDNTTSPYPSTLDVSAQSVSGLIGRMTVVLADVSHTRPDDIGVLLVHTNTADNPVTVQKVVLMRGAGGANPISHGRIIFDDTAPAISTGGPI